MHLEIEQNSREHKLIYIQSNQQETQESHKILLSKTRKLLTSTIHRSNVKKVLKICDYNLKEYKI